MAENTIRLDFRVLIYREDGMWIAHCLETDLVADGSSPQDAIQSWVDITNLQIEALMAEGDLNSLFSFAPPEIWRMYSTAEDRRTAKPRRAIKPVNRLNVRQLATV